MFDNISNKMKSAATALAILGIIGSIIIGSIIIAEANDSYYPSAREVLGGLLVMIVGSLSSWVSSFILYGFGQLIENTDVISSKYVVNTPDKAQSSSNDPGSFANSNDTKSSANLDPCIGTCELCDKENVKVVRCKIVDSMGRRYYYSLCADCIKEYDAVPIKK